MMKHLKITAEVTLEPPLPGETTAEYRKRQSEHLFPQLAEQCRRIIQTLEGDTDRVSQVLAQQARRFTELVEGETK